MKRRAAVLMLMLATPCAAQQSAPIMSGVRHTLDAAMTSATVEPSTGQDISLSLFVSSHAVESNFADKISVHFDRLSAGADDASVIWRDQACHQRRGYPKVTALAVDGHLGATAIAARPREIGRILPSDILEAQGASSRDQNGFSRNLRWRYKTTSGFVFAMHLLTEDCLIDPHAHTVVAR